MTETRSGQRRCGPAAPALPRGDLAACDVVLTSLPDDEALAAVALGPSGLVGIILSPMAVHISTSTVSPTLSRGIAEEHARHRQGYIAAPVLGNPDFARARKLFVLAAGSPSGLEKVRPLLERLGQRLFVIGEDAAMATFSSSPPTSSPRRPLNAWARRWPYCEKAGSTATSRSMSSPIRCSIPEFIKVMAGRLSTGTTARCVRAETFAGMLGAIFGFAPNET